MRAGLSGHGGKFYVPPSRHIEVANILLAHSLLPGFAQMISDSVPPEFSNQELGQFFYPERGRCFERGSGN